MNWTEEEYEQYLKRKNGNSVAVSSPHLEQNPSYGGMAKEKTKRFNSPVRLHIHSKRRRLADADGISAKAAIDGIVNAGILPDDSTKVVKEVSYSQEQIKSPLREETIITIEEI